MRNDHFICVYNFCSHLSPPLTFFKLLFRNSIQVSKSIRQLFTISVLMNKHYLITLRLKWQFSGAYSSSYDSKVPKKFAVSKGIAVTKQCIDHQTVI